MAKLAVQGGEKLRTRPFPDWPQFDERESQLLDETLKSRHWFAGMRGGEPGTRVAEFEKRWAGFCGVKHAIANTNGTISIELSLRAAGIGPGDEVIIPSLTFVATASAVLLVGAMPVMVDVEEATYCIDPVQIEAAITPRTRAIIPVHFAGHCCDMDRLLPLAGRHKLVIIEDAAHAHGATWRGRRAGSMGISGTFSFQESKTMTAGEGGVVTTNDSDFAELCVQYRSCGRYAGRSWYEHFVLPVNYRMVEWEAAVLTAQLERFPEQLAKRQSAAAFLNQRFAEIPGITAIPNDPRCEINGYYLFQFRYDAAQFHGVTRDTFVRALEAEGMPCHIGYPWPLQKNPFFNAYPSIRDAQFPIAEKLCRETVVIPHQVLLAGEKDLDDVIRAIEKIRVNCGELAGVTLSAAR